jgi:hypothetical protein
MIFYVSKKFQRLVHRVPAQCNPMTANITACHGMEWLAREVNTGNAARVCRTRLDPLFLEEWEDPGAWMR